MYRYQIEYEDINGNAKRMMINKLLSITELGGPDMDVDDMYECSKKEFFLSIAVGSTVVIPVLDTKRYTAWRSYAVRLKKDTGAEFHFKKDPVTRTITITRDK